MAQASAVTQNFVRYSADVEQAEPDFDQTLQQVLDDMKQHMRGLLKTEGIGLVLRNAHAKGYGLARGEFEILSGLPSEYSQGIYAKPDTPSGERIVGIHRCGNGVVRSRTSQPFGK